MNDLISRQTAMEIIQSMYPGMPRVPWMREDWQKRYAPYIRMENAIRALPSVQPEIIRCKDCVWRHAGYCEKYDDLIPFGCADKPWEDWFCADGERSELPDAESEIDKWWERSETVNAERSEE